VKYSNVCEAMLSGLFSYPHNTVVPKTSKTSKHDNYITPYHIIISNTKQQLVFYTFHSHRLVCMI